VRPRIWECERVVARSHSQIRYKLTVNPTEPEFPGCPIKGYGFHAPDWQFSCIELSIEVKNSTLVGWRHFNGYEQGGALWKPNVSVKITSQSNRKHSYAREAPLEAGISSKVLLVLVVWEQFTAPVICTFRTSKRV
jgi:hypothetical protein